MDLRHICIIDTRALDWRHAADMLSDPLYRNSLFMAFTSVFNAGCGFFFWMIAARLYTVEQVGLATALISAWWCCSCSWDSTYPRYAYKGEWMNLPGEVRLWLN